MNPSPTDPVAVQEFAESLGMTFDERNGLWYLKRDNGVYPRLYFEEFQLAFFYNVVQQQMVAAQSAINSPHYQIAVKQQKTKQGLWALTIAQYGQKVYGDIFYTEQEARDKIPSVLAELEVALNQYNAPEGGDS